MNAIPGVSVPTLAPGVRLSEDRATGEPVLLYPEGVLFLNETAHDIARRCDGNRNVDAIIDALASEYETDGAALRNDVMECLADLLRRRLVSLKS